MFTTTAKSLYSTVATLGLTRAQVRKLLPAWWVPEAEKHRDGIAELAMHLSRRLSIDLRSLLAGKIQPKGAVSNLAFKHRVNVDGSSLSAATYIASSLAQAILSALPSKYTPLPEGPMMLQSAVRKVGDGFLGFESLLALCWKHGIPVIPLPNLPVGVRKMDGAVLQVRNRPVIVIAKKKSSRAWLSFILAHEMGHIALGHLKPGSTIIDVSLQETTTYATDSSNDQQEADADAFALKAMGGSDVKSVISNWPSDLSPVELAVSARQASQRTKIEAGHFILRHAFDSKRWADAVSALGFLREDLDPESILLSHLKAHLDLELVAEDLQDMVQQVTGWNRPESRA
ncbi:MAG: ImmA/IrrE family metallo-endopeptidase [Candidimonas sp.]|nr:MAG: ImmA/IrrE family metallo-endopeptidase [Candidimonas sp.]TAM26679.1 MAG: ImmA/IrrE family metallo-endopeptidase [Candidimonas sp.]TAM75385.1 MAG: ImmA/IrrE family metallo-endopeptidase [Candidimonas sp.]